MQSLQQPTIPCTVISAGPDWITGTNTGGSAAHESDAFAQHEFERLADYNVKVERSSRLGYVGYSTPHFFYGARGRGRIMIASGEAAADLFRSIHTLSDNVTRLDVQVTIATLDSKPHLGVQAYELLKSKPPARIAVRNVTLISSTPQGETCNVGKRKSDQYGRIYDKASEAELGEARTLWRYEVEVKRDHANRWASALASDPHHADMARTLVHTWFDARGLQPPFGLPRTSNAFDLRLGRKEHDTLSWFRGSLSKTVERMIDQHGAAEVLDALGLRRYANLNPKEVDTDGPRA